MTWKPDIVIYHSPCDDGFGAAWAAWMRWKDACEYYPTNYGAPPPDVLGKDVLIVDFSYKAEVLAEMAEWAHSIVILDHHKTAEADLKAYVLGDVRDMDAFRFTIDSTPALEPPLQPFIAAYFDMDKSGARLAWEFCHPGEDVPMLILKMDEDYTEEKPHPEGDYAVVEVMGHVRHIGRYAEVERFGQKFCQVEPIYDGQFQPAVWVGGASIYQFRQITAAEAFKMAPKPYRYDPPAAISYEGDHGDGDDIDF